MSTPQPATTQSAAPPHSAVAKVLTLQQEEIVREFTEAYGLDRSQISFEGERPSPIFDFDALSTLSLALSDIPDIRVEPGDFNHIAGLTTANCRITLRDGRAREVYGNCLVGEVMHDGSIVEDIGQALNISRARALRNGLRAVGFDAYRAHNRAKTNQQQDTPGFSDVRSKELAEIHLLGEELGYIIGDDKSEWQKLIDRHFEGNSSSGDLNDLQRSQFLGMLRAWKSARLKGGAGVSTQSEKGQS